VSILRYDHLDQSRYAQRPVPKETIQSEQKVSSSLEVTPALLFARRAIAQQFGVVALAYYSTQAVNAADLLEHVQKQDNTYVFPSESGNVFIVSTDNDTLFHCSCLYHKSHGVFCRHTLAAIASAVRNDGFPQRAAMDHIIASIHPRWRLRGKIHYSHILSLQDFPMVCVCVCVCVHASCCVPSAAICTPYRFSLSQVSLFPAS